MKNIVKENINMLRVTNSDQESLMVCTKLESSFSAQGVFLKSSPQRAKLLIAF